MCFKGIKRRTNIGVLMNFYDFMDLLDKLTLEYCDVDFRNVSVYSDDGCLYLCFGDRVEKIILNSNN